MLFLISYNGLVLTS